MGFISFGGAIFLFGGLSPSNPMPGYVPETYQSLKGATTSELDVVDSNPLHLALKLVN